MKFKKLKLSGFKSFFDNTTLFIEDGLTGIVGPNGCGKSNIVEALRWCMGETSPKPLETSANKNAKTHILPFSTAPQPESHCQP